MIIINPQKCKIDSSATAYVLAIVNMPYPIHVLVQIDMRKEFEMHISSSNSYRESYHLSNFISQTMPYRIYSELPFYSLNNSVVDYHSNLVYRKVLLTGL